MVYRSLKRLPPIDAFTVGFTLMLYDGPKSAILARCRPIWNFGSRSVVVITHESPLAERRLAEKVSLVAAGDSDFSGMAYAAK